MQTIVNLAKKAAGYAAADLVLNGMLVGLGTGSTAAHFIKRLGERCRQGLKIQVVASSEKSLQLAMQEQIAIADINAVTFLDFSVDGADEIDTQNRMIKGGGGALLREKIIAAMSKEMVIIVDEHKLVEKLGTFPLAVEISPFAFKATCNQMQSLGYSGKLRTEQDLSGFFITDNGNYIYDIYFDTPVDNPESIDQKLKNIPGVMETGFFFGLTKKVMIGYLDGKVKVREGL